MLIDIFINTSFYTLSSSSFKKISKFIIKYAKFSKYNKMEIAYISANSLYKRK